MARGLSRRASSVVWASKLVDCGPADGLTHGTVGDTETSEVQLVAPPPTRPRASGTNAIAHPYGRTPTTTSLCHPCGCLVYAIWASGVVGSRGFWASLMHLASKPTAPVHTRLKQALL